MDKSFSSEEFRKNDCTTVNRTLGHCSKRWQNIATKLRKSVELSCKMKSLEETYTRLQQTGRSRQSGLQGKDPRISDVLYSLLMLGGWIRIKHFQCNRCLYGNSNGFLLSINIDGYLRNVLVQISNKAQVLMRLLNVRVFFYLFAGNFDRPE